VLPAALSAHESAAFDVHGSAWRRWPALLA